MPSAETTLSYIAAALSFLTIFTPLVLYVKYYSPAALIRYFDEILVDTKQIYSGAMEEGLLPSKLSTEAGAKLQRYQVAGDVLRSTKFNTLSLSQILRSYLQKSKTNRIERLSRGLKNLRTDILTASQEERERRATQHVPLGDEDTSVLNASLMDLMPISDSCIHGNGEPVRSQTLGLSNNQTDDPIILPLPSDVSPPYSPCSICLLKHWIYAHFSRRTKPSPVSVGQTLEIESPSRTATLTEELPSSGRRSRWWRTMNEAGWDGAGDVEAGQPVSKSSEYVESEAFSLEPSQIEMDITSIVGSNWKSH